MPISRADPGKLLLDRLSGFPCEIKAGFPGPGLDRGGVQPHPSPGFPALRVEGAEFPQGVGIPAEPLALGVESGDGRDVVLDPGFKVVPLLAGGIDIVGRGGRHHDDAVSGPGGQDRLTGRRYDADRNAERVVGGKAGGDFPVAGGIDAKDHDAAEARGIGLQRRSDATGPPLVPNKVAGRPMGVQPRLLESLQGSLDLVRRREKPVLADRRDGPGEMVVLGANSAFSAAEAKPL